MKKVLHVVGALDRGGVEMWLVDVVKNTPPHLLRHDFIALKGYKGVLSDEVEKFGSRVIPLPLKKMHLLQFATNFMRILKNNKYDVVHTHVFLFSGVIALLSKLAGVRSVIVQSHNESSSKERTILRDIYESFTRQLIINYADYGYAVSDKAGRGLFGNFWGRHPKFKKLYLSVDLSSFYVHPNGNLRKELGLEGKKVVAHIGRFTKQKNHEFLVDIGEEVLRVRKDVIFLLVGDGPLREKIEEKVRRKGLNSNFIFTGVRGDTRSILTEVTDLVLFPSLHEGLPVAILETQAAGKRALLSDRISREVAVIPELITFINLEEGAKKWAEKVLELLALPPFDRKKALRIMESSPFNVKRTLDELLRVYGSL